jgi:YebC/PmpR family DNA-binding regulatory protein
VLTDNRNRTASEVRHMFDKKGGNLGATNCVNWMFHRKGVINIPLGATSEDDLMELALEHGGEDVVTTDDGYLVTCGPAEFHELRKAILDAGLQPHSDELTRVPENYVTINEKQGEKVLALLEALDDLDDVQAVHANLQIETPD